MRVLWLCNVAIPSAAQALKIDEIPIGGWLVTVANRLKDYENIDFFYSFYDVRMPYGIKSAKQDGVVFYSISDAGKGIQTQTELFCELIKEIVPDVIHIWGTEHMHTYAMTEAAKYVGIGNKVIISIQGLVSILYKHYYAGIPLSVQMIPTLRDIIRNDTLHTQKKQLYELGRYEVKALENAQHIIGRTFWDKACTEMINPKAQYHFNNETLRPAFYKNYWDYKKCIKHSIFVSQAQHPIKGFHYLLEAVSILKNRYPDISVYVSGYNNSFKTGLRVNAYGKYIQNLIKKWHLKNIIKYIGLLDEQHMLQSFLNAEVFVSPSVIENSPNSVGEAMLLGMPVVSSNVGGVSTLLIHEKDGFLYQADAPYLLAYYISKLFDNQQLEITLGQAAQKHARQTHDIERNFTGLMEIYEKI